MPGMDIAQKLTELGWTLPAAPKPIAAYVPAVRTGNLLFVSGQLPMRDGKLLATGKVPSSVSIELAQKAAGQCAVNALAIVLAELGDWERLFARGAHWGFRSIGCGFFGAGESRQWRERIIAAGAGRSGAACAGRGGDERFAFERCGGSGISV